MDEDIPGPNAELLPYDDLEHYPKFWNRIWATISLFLLNPNSAFERIHHAEFGFDALSFLLAITWPIHIVGALFKLLAVYSPWIHGHYSGRLNLSDVTLLNTVLSIVFYPVGVWISFWIAVAISHGSLWIWRGLYNGYSITLTARASGFALGIFSLFYIPFSLFFFIVPVHQAWPYLGVIIQILVLTLVGFSLAKSHCIQVWRGIAAIFTPMLLLLLGIAWLTHGSVFKAFSR